LLTHYIRSLLAKNTSSHQHSNPKCAWTKWIQRKNIIYRPELSESSFPFPVCAQHKIISNRQIGNISQYLIHYTVNQITTFRTIILKGCLHYYYAFYKILLIYNRNGGICNTKYDCCNLPPSYGEHLLNNVPKQILNIPRKNRAFCKKNQCYLGP